MTRAEQPTAHNPAPRRRPGRGLPRARRPRPAARAAAAGGCGARSSSDGIGDALALLVLVLLALQAAVAEGAFGGGYRGVALAVAAVFGARVLATLLFGAVLLGPLTSLTSQEGPLDRRWTMVGADGLRAALLIIAPLWIDWTPENALAILLVTAFVTGVAERFWTVCRGERGARAAARAPAGGRDGAPAAGPHGRAAAPVAAYGLRGGSPRGGRPRRGHRCSTTCWAPGSTGSASTRRLSRRTSRPGCSPRPSRSLYFLELPDTRTPRARSPLEGLRRPKAGTGVDKGRTGAIPLLVLACAAVAERHRRRRSPSPCCTPRTWAAGPVMYGLLVAALTGGVVMGIRRAPSMLPALSRRRLLALAIALTGIALLVAGLVPDVTTRAADRRRSRASARASPRTPGTRCSTRRPRTPGARA